MTESQLTNEERQALISIYQELAQDEYRHYESMGSPDNHMFTNLRVLRTFLAKNGSFLFDYERAQETDRQ